MTLGIVAPFVPWRKNHSRALGRRGVGEHLNAQVLSPRPSHPWPPPQDGRKSIQTKGCASCFPLETPLARQFRITSGGNAAWGQPPNPSRLGSAGAVGLRSGAGLASLVDAEGYDWISYHPGGGPAGEYRGIPNVATNDAAGDTLGLFHPGYTRSTSTIRRAGPIKLTIVSSTADGDWEKQDQMTVFGFGRGVADSKVKALKAVVGRFTLGFLPVADHQTLAQRIQSAYEPLSVGLGPGEAMPVP